MRRLRNQWTLLAIIALGLVLHVLASLGRAPVTSPALANADQEPSRMSSASGDAAGATADGRAKSSVVIELLSLDGEDIQIVIEPPEVTP